MCMNCNAMCGKCRPPLLKAFVCDSCGKAVILTREDCLYVLGYWQEFSSNDRSRIAENLDRRFACKHCGNSLVNTVRKAVISKECEYSGIKCGWPCGKWNKKRREGEDPCRKQIVAKNRIAAKASSWTKQDMTPIRPQGKTNWHYPNHKHFRFSQLSNN